MLGLHKFGGVSGCQQGQFSLAGLADLTKAEQSESAELQFYTIHSKQEALIAFPRHILLTIFY